MIGDKKGFTLMEMLLALALFSVIVTIAADLFLAFQRTSRKTENLETVVASTRFIVERMTSEIRSGTINYDEYEALGGVDTADAQRQLHLLNSSDQEISFSFINADDTVLLTLPGSDSEPLTGSEVHVRDARFLIFPEEDPFEFIVSLGDPRAGQYRADTQPRVTIFLSLDNALEENHRDYTRYDVQTTISSRTYRR